MADLAGSAPPTAQGRAVDHDAGAHTLADRDDQEPVAVGAAEGVLAERGDVGVVRDVHRKAQPLRQLRGERHPVPAAVGGLDHDAVRVDDAGRADADADDGLGRRCEQEADEAREEVDHVGAGPALDGELLPVDEVTGQGRDRAVHHGAVGEVHRDDLEGVSAHPDEDGRLPDPLAGAHTELFDESLGDERRDEVGDGDAREAGGSRQVGARRRALVEEVAQDERPVVGPSVLGEHLGARTERASEPSPGAPAPVTVVVIAVSRPSLRSVVNFSPVTVSIP
ncbi:hypothetical protein GCM10025864_43880 [Luteimicrobium album]|uniref:Uncharacterized protein n=1 Tax=Luteimicrobium album TaxID=1054550 RepID=A0ABQ6IAB3_9MICO|nr:hypothetical protein GCM10025864_43880 [Luteimicrobium album]